MKFTQFAVLLMTVFPLIAQNTEKKPRPVPGDAVKFVELQYLGKDGSDRLDRVVTAIDRLLGGKACVYSDPVLKITAIRGTIEGIPQAEQMLRRYDVPNPAPKSEGPRQIQLLLYVLEDAESSSAVPPDLASPIEQIRNTFGISGLRLIETLLLQGVSGSSFALNGSLSLTGDDTKKSVFSAQYKGISYEAATKAILVNAFEFHVRGTGIGSSIATNLNLREGQKLVLGKLTRAEKARPVFLVIGAKVEQP